MAGLPCMCSCGPREAVCRRPEKRYMQDLLSTILLELIGDCSYLSWRTLIMRIWASVYTLGHAVDHDKRE